MYSMPQPVKEYSKNSRKFFLHLCWYAPVVLYLKVTSGYTVKHIMVKREGQKRRNCGDNHQGTGVRLAFKLKFSQYEKLMVLIC